MMRKLMTATAIALLATSGAVAAGSQDAMNTNADIYIEAQGHNELASSIIGETVYTSDAQDEAVGDINDLIVGDDGTIEAVVIGVGGFLGVGEKNVAVSFDSIHWVDSEDAGHFAVFEASHDALLNAPEFTTEETAMAPTDEDAMPMTDETEEVTEAPAETMKDDDVAMAPADEPADAMDATDKSTNDEVAMAPADEPVDTMAPTTETTAPALIEVTARSLSAGDLIGSTVYAENDENVGEVGDVRLTSEGQVDSVIVDVGGFLGLGEKPVAISFDSLIFKTDEGRSGSFYVYTDFSRDELDAATTYDKASYDDERDMMRLSLR